MRATIHWITVPALMAAAPSSGWATSYLSVEEAQQAIFPGAAMERLALSLTPEQRKQIQTDSGTPVRAERVDVWKVAGGGWFFVDEVIGKHERITYALGLNADGSVKQVEVLEYRENYGGEILRRDWLDQFANKEYGAPLKLDRDIKNISGATLSCRHLSEGVKRLLATYELLLAK